MEEILSRYIPNLRQIIIGRHVDGPPDISGRLGLDGGDFVNHIALTLNQVFIFRPTFEMGRYITPIKNLYLTGSGTHPRGGINTIAGYNTAHMVLRQQKRLRRLIPIQSNVFERYLIPWGREGKLVMTPVTKPKLTLNIFWQRSAKKTSPMLS